LHCYDEKSERECDWQSKAVLSCIIVRRQRCAEWTENRFGDGFAPIFEREVKSHLTGLPECGLSDFRTRDIEENDETLVEIASFGYINHNSLQCGVSSPESGISLIIPRDCNELKAIAAPPIKLSHSRGPRRDRLREKVEKYVIGETYSGQRASKIKAKVDELEIKITKMVERYKRPPQHGLCLGCG
jgi:hypothetical protein